jgi:hypothetical protein
VAAHPVALENLRIVAEVLTPHFNNNLRPIFFPAVEAGSEFGFAIIGQREPEPEDLNLEALIQQAGTWLRRAITEGGIGAKTGAGYGWFLIDPQSEARRRDQLAAEARAVEVAEIAAAQRAEQAKAARLNISPPSKPPPMETLTYTFRLLTDNFSHGAYQTQNFNRPELRAPSVAPSRSANLHRSNSNACSSMMRFACSRSGTDGENPPHLWKAV